VSAAEIDIEGSAGGRSVAAFSSRNDQTTTAGFSGILKDGVGPHRLENRGEKDPFAPQAVSLQLSHSCVGAQLTSHGGNLKVRELCLAAFAAAWAIDGNARRSAAG
jgi:hypothetical protein